MQQLAQVICSHNGRSPLCQLHDSAASEYLQYADQIADRVKFLTRKDTANIHEVSQLVPPDLLPAEEQAEKAFAQLPPFEARKTFLLGPPKPACCPERSQTAEGIHKLRQAQDAEIGKAHCIALLASRIDSQGCLHERGNVSLRQTAVQNFVPCSETFAHVLCVSSM